MKLSKRGEYALKAMIELAINYDRGEAVTLIGDVARRKAIPPKYLEQILLDLKHEGILVSKRGVGGGYTLSRSPEGISLGQILRAVEGPLAPADCVNGNGGPGCPDEASCALYGVMLEVGNAVAAVLDNTSLRDVARKTLELIDQKNSVLNYAI